MTIAAATYAQDFSKDTIKLSEIHVKEDLSKKPKIKTIDYGKKKPYYGTNYSLFYTETRPLYYLIDDLPYGVLQEITIPFGLITKSVDKNEGSAGKIHVNLTEYELTLYEADADGAGRKINTTPIKIVLKEGSSFKKDIKVNVSNLNFKTNSFYIFLEKKTDTSCYECGYYAPVSYKTVQPAYFGNVNNTGAVELTPSKYFYNLGIKVKTLTRQY